MEEINILVIEDKNEDGLFLEEVLKAEGYKVWLVTEGQEGLKLAKNTYFAAVITELHMAGMNGLEITRAMLKILPQTNVVVITPFSFISSAIETMEEGGYGYITKPFNRSEIKLVIKRAVERFFFISSRKEDDRFAELSVKDALTGVFNRRLFNIYLDNKINIHRTMSEKFSLLMLDIDHFKQYNDTHGHLAGDELLRNMSKSLQGSLREGDIIFRYGGEEFVVFLANTNKHGASMVAERIRNSVSLYVPATISIGVATFPDDGVELEGLISKADAALYKAKESGRNRVCLA